MNLLEAMRVAVAVAQYKSFSLASRELRISAPSVSRIIAELEDDLGVRLFNRTTPQLNLTDAGAEFVFKSSGLLEEINVLRSSVRAKHEIARGHLRVSCVTAFGNECLAPVIPEFVRQFPQIGVSVEMGNRMVDLIGEHFDVAIRVGPLSDSALIARRISAQRIIFVATPEACGRFGMPTSLEEIREWPSVVQVSGEWGRSHRFTCRGAIQEFEVTEDITMNSAQAVKNACLSGTGYSLLSEFMVRKEIADGRLVRLLPEYEPIEQPIYAFYAQRRYLPQRIKVFIDFLAKAF